MVIVEVDVVVVLLMMVVVVVVGGCVGGGGDGGSGGIGVDRMGFVSVCAEKNKQREKGEGNHTIN